MIFNDILRAVADLNDKERQLLRRYLDPLPEQSFVMAPKERMRQLNAALDAMGDGLSHIQLQEMTAEMTAEYVEVWDESEWIE